MTSDIWNDGSIWPLMGRYVSYTGFSSQLIYEGVLVGVDHVRKTFTLAKYTLATNTGNKADVTGGYERRIAIQTITWAQGDDVKIVHLDNSDDDRDEIITEKNSRKFKANFLLELVRLSKIRKSKKRKM